MKGRVLAYFKALF